MPEDLRNIFETELGLQGFFFSFFLFSHLWLVAVGHKVEYLYISRPSISKPRLQIGINCRAFQTYEIQALHHTPYSRNPLGQKAVESDSTML